MSGWHFNYVQHHIATICEEVKLLIETNGSDEKDEWGYKLHYNFQEPIIEKFKEAIPILQLAYIYAQRIDWLVCGDDGEELFFERLDEDICKVHIDIGGGRCTTH